MCSYFPELYKICEQKHISVFKKKNNEPSISFSRWLVDDLQADWLKIQDDIMQYILQEG